MGYFIFHKTLDLVSLLDSSNKHCYKHWDFTFNKGQMPFDCNNLMDNNTRLAFEKMEFETHFSKFPSSFRPRTT